MLVAAFVGVLGDVAPGAARAGVEAAGRRLVHRGTVSVVPWRDGFVAVAVGSEAATPSSAAPGDEVAAGSAAEGGARVSVRVPAPGIVELAADALGRRTLHATALGRALCFSSELGALAVLRRALGGDVTLDPRAVRRLYALSFVPAPCTPFRELLTVPAGHRITWMPAAGFAAPAQVFELGTTRNEPDEARDVAALEAALATVAAGARSLAGGRVGVLLSSGLDSALVGRALGRVAPGALALTIDLEEGSELGPARAIASSLGLAHASVPVTGADAAALLDTTVRALDVPVGDPVVLPFVAAARAARERGLSVLWTGEGGDQLFAGWSTKPMLAWARYAEPDDDPAPPFLRTFHKLAEIEDEALGPALRDPADAPLTDDLRPHLERATERHDRFFSALCEANLALKGAGNILPRIDRALASSGVVAESPLLHPDFVRVAFAVDPTQKQRGNVEKWIVRRMLAGSLPPEVVDLPKRGMRVPVRAWLDGPLAELTRDALSSRAFRERGHVTASFAEALLADAIEAPDLRRRRRDEWLWMVLFVELWMREHVDGQGATS